MSRTNNLVARSLRKAVLALAVSAILPATNAVAQTSESVSVFDIPAGKLSDALDSFMSQSGAQILYKSDLVAGKKSQALRGSMDGAAALTQLLSGTGLVWEKANGSTFVIKHAKAPPQKPDRPQGKARTATGNDAENEPTTMDTMVVTGTRIRGGSTPSPVIAIGSERIREEGFTDLGEVIRSIPQNFGGGQNPGITAGATGGGNDNRNITGGSGLNLRGLGQDASLTLLNGRRMSYGGFSQMVDISAIPVEAVDRIEIVADGASAIYGSDAVGGVGNVILSREFDGVTVGTRYGTATEGGLTTREYSVTAGTTWATGGLIATWKNNSNDPIYSDQREYTKNMYEPSTLYQAGDLRSGLLSAHQSLGDIGEIRLDAFRTEREVFTDLAYATSYEHYAPNTATSLISPSIEFFLPHDWTLSIGGTWGRERTDVDNTIETLATGVSTLSRLSYNNTSRTYEANAEGPLFPLAGGDARLAVGAGYRRNEFQNRNLISGYTQVDGDASSRFAYAEISLPLIGEDQGISGVRRLTLTGAIRGEDHDSFGGVTTPKLGLVYSPNADFTMKASWGKSFKVPTLSQQHAGRDAILFPAIVLGGADYAPGATALYLVGGNPDLSPERARTRSASLAFHPESLPDLEAELTWFDIDYTDRIVQPLVPAQALSNPAFAEFINHAPTAAELDDILRTYRFINATGVAYDAGNVAVIAPNLYRNTSRQRVKGLDLSGSYRLEFATGRLTIRGSASWLDSTRQVSSAQSAYDLAGTLFYPAKASGRFGAVWNQGGVTASLFGNYKDGVTNTADGKKGASFTTFDAALRYDTGGRNDALSDLGLELSVQNMFDRAPPLYAATSLTYAPFDSTNYSAIGRYLSLSVSKHW